MLMKLGPFEIMDAKSARSMRAIVNAATLDNDTSPRKPPLSVRDTPGSEVLRIPYFPAPMQRLYDLAYHSDLLRVIVIQKQEAIAREGIEMSPNFAVRCEVCDLDFEQPPDGNICQKCQGQLIEPDQNEVKDFKEWRKCVNVNKIDLDTHIRQLDADEEITDNFFAVAIKEYQIGETGEIEAARMVQNIRGDPVYFRLVMNKYGTPAQNDQGDSVGVCVRHRKTLQINQEKCPECGALVYPAWWKVEDITGSGPDTYYLEDEVFHDVRYAPGFIYGFSLIYANWNKILLLMHQDIYMRDYYTAQRSPQTMAFVKSSNWESFKKAWEWAKSQLQVNRWGITPIPVNTDSDKILDIVDLSRPLTELQAIEFRNQIRREVGMAWGMQPMFTGDVSKSGGLNNESQQLVVTERAYEQAQASMNRYLAWLTVQRGYKHHTIKLISLQKKDELRDLQIVATKIANAQSAKNLGCVLKLDDKGEFTFSEPEGGFPVGTPTPSVGGPGTIQPTEPQVAGQDLLRDGVSNAKREEQELMHALMQAATTGVMME
jgi:hypothetical protein